MGGIVRLGPAALLVAVNAWLAGSTFVPVARQGRPPEYVLVSASAGRLIACVALSALVLLAVQLTIARRHGRPLRVLGWTALSLVPLLNLARPLAGRFPPFTYVSYELRWWWWAFLLLAILWRLSLPLALGRTAGRWAVAGLVVIPLAWVITFTPYLRFSGILHGDEPKYIRYCENFYQGLGVDIANKRTIPELGADDRPHVWNNIRLLFRAIPQEAGALAADVRRLVGLPAPPRLVAEQPTEAMVFSGKRSGTVYQLHSPGLSFLLFPGYYLDRRVTGSGLGYRGEFPAEMPAVHLTLLALYVGYGLALYALLRAYPPARDRAWALALLGTLSFPASAFAFQIYPEIAAGIAIFLLVRWLIAPAAGRSAGAAAYGALAGFLPWLHVRFGLASLVILAWMVTDRTRPRRSRAAFAAGLLGLLAALSLYTYHLTGSLLPVATYGAQLPLSVARVLKGVPAFAFDRVWGILPHSPVYLLAVPGVALAWRQRRAATLWIVALMVAVAVPAAGHGFWAGGATPGRYLVSIAPLLLLFGADLIAAWSGGRVAIAAAAALTIISLETAVTYNLHHRKEVGPLVSDGVSGWRLNDLFPSLGTDTWTGDAADVALLAAWTAMAVLLAALAMRHVEHRQSPAGAARGPRVPADALAALVLLAIAGLGVGRLRGAPIDEAYMMPAKDARERVLAAYADSGRCFVCYSSAAGAVAPTEALGNDLGAVTIRVEPVQPHAGDRVKILVRPRSGTGEFVLATVRLDLGDGSISTHPRLFRDLDERHTYNQPGEYRIHAWVTASASEPVEADLNLHVSPSQ